MDAKSTVQFIGATHPLKTEIKELEIQHGVTVTEILKIAQPDPVLLQDATVYIDGVKLAPNLWGTYIPPIDSVVAARIIPYLRGGGGGGGGKNPLRTLLTIGLVVATGGLAAPLGAAIGLSGAVATAVGGVLISVAGGLLINAIAPIRPPALGALSGGSTASPALFIEGGSNRASPFAVVPSLLGFYRYHPPLGSATFTESLGDNNRFRMLLVAGLGPLGFSDWRIGNTPLDNFEDFELQERSGLISDTPLTNFPNQVEQDQFSIKLTVLSSWHQRTSGPDADELSVDLAFPSGLINYNSAGKKRFHTIILKLEFRKVGTTPWLPVPDPSTTFDDIDISGSVITLTAQRAGLMRHGIRWNTPERAQYEVQLLRDSPPDLEHEQGAANGDTQIDRVFWSILRTITNEDPIQLPVPVAKAGLSIRATDQLSGVLEEVNVLVKSIVLDWDSGAQTWVSRVSNNPASLFRHVLQGPAKAVPLPDNELDLEKLQEWHEFCSDNGFTFNMLRDFEASVFDTLSDIASAGRAGLDITDGKWSVVIDLPVTITSTYINPRNSTNFEAERLFEEVPHAWRIRFPNESENFTQDVRTVFRDGFNELNATLYSQMEFPGVTNSEQIWKLGRYYAAVAVQRPERWTVTQDFESLIAKRGMRIKIAHDVMLIGSAYGRITDLGILGSDIISITVDQDLIMEVAKTYGISIRRNIPGDVALTVLLDTVVGISRTVTPTTPIPLVDDVAIGDLFSYGEFGQEVEDALVLSVEPQNDFAAKITLVPYRGDEIYGADSGAIPPYVPTISVNVFLPPVVVTGINSESDINELGVGETTSVIIEITVEPISVNGSFIEVQQRATGTNEVYYASNFTQKSSVAVKIDGLLPGEIWDFRLRWNHNSLLPGPWAISPNNLVVGLFTSPNALVNMEMSVVSGVVIVRWSSPVLSDLITRGIARFRHSSDILTPSWSASTFMGEAPARSLTTILPLKNGTYLGRIFDDLTGMRSTTIFLGVVQASVLTFVNVTSINEQPDYIGTHDGTVSDPFFGILKLANFISVDDYSPTVDEIDDWDSEGGIVSNGTYDFTSGVDLGVIKGVRVSSRVTAVSVTVINLIDTREELIDSWEDFDGVDQAEADIQVWVRFTNDNPVGFPTWSEFGLLVSSEYQARAFQFQARLTTKSSSVNIHVTELGIDIDEVE